jgi:hypothetical protein
MDPTKLSSGSRMVFLYAYAAGTCGTCALVLALGGRVQPAFGRWPTFVVMVGLWLAFMLLGVRR